ncbi:hypothetical protein C1646_633179 [Rhizophagus diaphanus]|nr:hypothetical protein C1646_633179 [Rhizophagus diaphanus] [Rhizophagus sp. MUCL 43196]
MELSENPEAYSNPKKFLPLPFPFLGERKPVERFFINDDDKFIYMGRKAFINVLNTINELKRGRSYMDCFIYGTIGYGKSYILATIACFLLRTGKRVVYLPDCHELAKKPENYIKLALFLAYADNIEKINEISACKTTDDIVAFCELSEPLYFIVDQMNALDYRNNTEIEVKKAIILDVLNRMTSEHYYIKSSSANNESALYLIQKQTNDRRIELYGGFDEDEMSQWWMQNRKNLPSMDNEQWKKIEYTTGRNPLFLSFFLGSEKNFDDAWKRLKLILMEKIQVQITNFSDIIKRERWDTYVFLFYFVVNKLYKN